MEITIAELDAEGVEMLPAREALGLANTAFVFAANSSTALNALTVLSLAASQANQGIVISQ
jgi:hypothetical protein